jgi:hypothetical protein
MRAMLVLTAALFLSFAANVALAAAPAVLVVVEKTGALPPRMERAILSAAGEGVAAAGAVAKTTGGDPGSGACITEPCLAGLATKEDVAYVVVLKARGTSGSYQVLAAIHEGRSGKLAESAERDCAICAEPDFMAAVREVTVKLCEGVLPAEREPAPAARAVAEGPPLAEPASPPRPAEQSGWHVPSYASVAAIVVGAGMIGTGVYLISIDGKGTCDLAPGERLCLERYKTQTLGAGLLAGGGLVALGGLVSLMFFGPSPGQPAIAFTGSSVSVSGAF